MNRSSSPFLKLGLCAALVCSSLVVGCSSGAPSDSKENGGEAQSSADAFTEWVNNSVTADRLYLRSQDATNGAIIGAMSFCSTFYVDHVDWNTRMAYGYSYQLGRSGWANANYLTKSGCIYGGGEG